MRRFAQAIADVDSAPRGLPSDVVSALVQAPDRYNVGKGKAASVLAVGPHGAPVVLDMIWGLIPRWSKEPATPYTTVTARLDRAPKSRIFAQAWQQRHCVVPMSGYFKWDRQRRPPWPRFIQRSDGQALLAAGLWERWGDPDDPTAVLSFTLLTGPNSAIPAPLSQDGPLFLEPAVATRWLSGDFSTPAALRRRALVPALESYPVSRIIRNADLDDYTLLEPVDPDAEDTTALSSADDDADWDGEDA